MLTESETFLESILNTTLNLIYVYDFERQKVVFANKKITDITGFLPEDFTNTNTDLFTSLVHPDDIQTLELHRETIKESKTGKFPAFAFRIKNKKGQWSYQLSRDAVLKRNSQGQVISYTAVVTDVSEMKEINEQLVVKNQELQSSNTELDSFSSIASHDLKEPLRKIMLFSNLVIAAEKGKLNETSDKYLERVIVSAGRLQQLIDDLISYSRTGTERIKYAKVDLGKLLKSVHSELKEIIDEKQAVIEVQENLPAISGLASQLQQLFVNLISNALKYSKKDKKPHVKIGFEKASAEDLAPFNADSDANYYKITVADNGIGFSNEYKDSIFEAFKRLHGKDDYAGTGIGLAICKKIVVNHKGFIASGSEIGKGSEFTVILPDGIKKRHL